MLPYINEIFIGITFIISISLHEYAHAWTSNYFGDPTPKLQGRLTPNPLVHIDPIGFALIFFINFGRGRPVIVNPSYYKNKLRDELLVALAGPLTNIILAILGTCIMLIYLRIQGVDQYFYGQDLIVQFRYVFSRINVALAVFNLLPIPPLDGYRIIKYIKPTWGAYLDAYRRHIGMVFIALILLPTPVGTLIHNFISTISQSIYLFIQGVLSIILL